MLEHQSHQNKVVYAELKSKWSNNENKILWESCYYDTAVVQVGINGITNYDSLKKVENLVLNLENIATKLKNYGIKPYVYLA